MKSLLVFSFVLLSASASAQQRPSSTDEEPTPIESESGGSLMWILPTVLALGAGGYAWFVGEAAKRRNKQLEGYIKQVSSRQKKAAGGAQTAAPAASATVVKDDRAVQELQKRIASLEKEVDELRGQMKRQPQQLSRQNPKTSPQASAQPSQQAAPTLPKQQPALQQTAGSPQPASSIMATVNKATTTAPVFPQTKWAKYADAGDGFSTAALADAQDGEKIFELTIVDASNARFRVVSAREPQQMALHDPTFYFSKTCTYDTLPTPQSSITTDAPGTLKLVSGKWTIQQPAKIRFS